MDNSDSGGPVNQWTRPVIATSHTPMCGMRTPRTVISGARTGTRGAALSSTGTSPSRSRGQHSPPPVLTRQRRVARSDDPRVRTLPVARHVSPLRTPLPLPASTHDQSPYQLRPHDEKGWSSSTSRRRATALPSSHRWRDIARNIALCTDRSSPLAHVVPESRGARTTTRHAERPPHDVESEK